MHALSDLRLSCIALRLPSLLSLFLFLLPLRAVHCHTVHIMYNTTCNTIRSTLSTASPAYSFCCNESQASTLHACELIQHQMVIPAIYQYLVLLCCVWKAQTNQGDLKRHDSNCPRLSSVVSRLALLFCAAWIRYLIAYQFITASEGTYRRME